MRMIVALVAGVLLTLSAEAARAGSRFDTTSEAYVALPPGGAAYVEKLAAALDRGKVKAFVALAPADLDIDGVGYSHARLKTAIKTAGGLDKAFGLEAGTWVIEADDVDFAIYRGTSTSRFVVGMSGDDRFGLLKIIPPDRPTCSGSTPGQVRISDGKVTGGTYEWQIVRRYLRRNAPKLDYCYDKRKLAVADLRGGNVAIELSFRGDGKVNAAKATGIDDEVASCVEMVLRTMELPKPKDGGSVTATATVEIGVDHPGVFDTSRPSCAALPQDVREHAEKIAAAVEGDDAKGFVAVLPATVVVLGKKLTRAKIAKAIAKAGSVKAWLGLTHSGTPWTVREMFGEYELIPYHESHDDFSPSRRFFVQKRGKKLRLRAITDD